MLDHVDWQFPLPRPHTGLMLGNGTTGMLIWGEDRSLKITLGRADFWDHRGGMPWSEKQSFKKIRHYLENNDEVGLRSLFACATEKQPGQPPRPSVIPVGRLELRLPENASLRSGQIDLAEGIASVCYRQGTEQYAIRIQLSMKEQLFAVEMPPCSAIEIIPLPSWQIMGDTLKNLSFPPPEMLTEPELSGWIQRLPSDPALAVGYRLDHHRLWGVTTRHAEPMELRRKTLALLDRAVAQGLARLERDNSSWWHDYWRDIPSVELPNPTLEFIYYYGLYKFAGLTNPSGVPATLQGPWIEDYHLPPWSSDYHFNINVQMCYWPAYKANRISHLLPMFEMVLSWRPLLRKIAHDFVGIDDGYMMPHAVDDRCTCMGSFWTGTIDHGCAAWIAQMMYQYYRFSGDVNFLREKAFDFMKGVFRVYEAMLEEHDGKYVLPVSVSPEYRGDRMNAWGVNASFQLAAIHRLVEDLQEAASVLGEKPLPSWLQVAGGLPKASLFGTPGEERIGLWDGTDLEESHRHHSHLAGLCPFDTIDYDAPEWREIVSRSIRHWIHQGMGMWSGWCMPWASMIHSRLHNGRMSELILEIWEHVFTNAGHGTLHDANFPGFSLLIGTDPLTANQECSLAPDGRFEIMQMDAGMGAVTAVQDMLLHVRRGILQVFPGAPITWRHARFERMPGEGGVLVSAEWQDGRVLSFTVEAQRPGTWRFANPWPNRSLQIHSGSDTVKTSAESVLTLTLAAGEAVRVALTA